MVFVYKIYDFLSRYRKALLAALVLFIAIFGISVLLRGAVGKPYRTDVTVFLRAAQAVDAGQDIYDAKTERQWNYVYLPLLAVLLRPAAHLPLWVVVPAWYALSMAMLAGTVIFTSRLCSSGQPVWRPALLALVFSLPATLNAVSRGQLGVLSLFFAVWCFLLYREKRAFLAGFLLGFAVVLKISPVLFLFGFFFFERAWRVLAGALLACILFVFVIPGALVGWEQNLEYLRTWFETMRLATSQLAQQSQLWAQLLDPYSEDNQSLYSVLLRLLGPARDHFSPGSDMFVRGVSRGLAGVLLLMASGGMLLRGFKKINRGRLLEYSLFPMVMLYASPVSEDHHYTVIYLLYAAAFYLLADGELSVKVRRWIEAAVWICALSVLLGMIFDPLNFVGAMVWGTLVLWLTLFFVQFFRVLKLPAVIHGPGDVSNGGEQV
ncbi:MAG: DUF2029 domain-containing protein [Candidatus Omnitrophica bacterium]|nr:DUF2029 domain-containing protein [Candidatus Omnitrophota bacterium]